MKVKSITVAVIALFSVLTISAQNAPQSHNSDVRIAKRVAAMKVQLNLDDKQEKAITDLYTEQAAQDQKIRENRKATHDKVNAVLTPDQKAKMEQLRAENRTGHGRGHGKGVKHGHGFKDGNHAKQGKESSLKKQSPKTTEQ